MSYQNTTGPLMANSHPGSYCGQDAYTDMFVTEEQNENDFLCRGGETSQTLDASYYKGAGARNGKEREIIAMSEGYTPDVAHALKGKANCQFREDSETYAVDCRNGTEDRDASGSLQMSAGHNLNSNNVCRTQSVVRRLTPGECEALQGFPQGWTDLGEWIDTKGKVHQTTDSARYKALGNSIAVGYANRQSGFWMWLLKRISAQYERSATMASLFDGIGGFPLAWEFYNGKGSAVWASEIEEFPIAVTKRHFPEPWKGEE